MKHKLLLASIFALTSIVAYQKYLDISTDQNVDSQKTCKIGGCSGQICMSSESPNGITTCQANPEYACYRNSKCEVQSNGQCGWTQTNELKKCLLKYRDL